MQILSTALSALRIASLRSKIDFLLENKIVLLCLLCYLLIITVVAIAVTVYDKWASKHKREARTRESDLLLISSLGGSLPMLLTMLGIRHKTKHIKFMLGIPLIMVAQIAVITILLIL